MPYETFLDYVFCSSYWPIAFILEILAHRINKYCHNNHSFSAQVFYSIKQALLVVLLVNVQINICFVIQVSGTIVQNFKFAETTCYYDFAFEKYPFDGVFGMANKKLSKYFHSTFTGLCCKF